MGGSVAAAKFLKSKERLRVGCRGCHASAIGVDGVGDFLSLFQLKSLHLRGLAWRLQELDTVSGQSFLSMCSESEEQEAQKLCTKHLQHSRLLPEILADCVFDVCHGGGESAAESLAALFSDLN